MASSPELRLYNTLTREKERFEPIDRKNVRVYACGPTVYDHLHIGNGRMLVVFDVLFRLLRHLYGPDQVTYVRNITVRSLAYDCVETSTSSDPAVCRAV
jgi:cysteinyl-tRNA synthetase